MTTAAARTSASTSPASGRGLRGRRRGLTDGGSAPRHPPPEAPPPDPWRGVSSQHKCEMTVTKASPSSPGDIQRARCELLRWIRSASATADEIRQVITGRGRRRPRPSDYAHARAGARWSVLREDLRSHPGLGVYCGRSAGALQGRDLRAPAASRFLARRSGGAGWATVEARRCRSRCPHLVLQGRPVCGWATCSTSRREEDLEKVIYFAAYMITVDDESRHRDLSSLEAKIDRSSASGSRYSRTPTSRTG